MSGGDVESGAVEQIPASIAPETSEERQDQSLGLVDYGCFSVLALCVCALLVVFVERLTPRIGQSHIRRTTIDAATIRQAMVLFRAENPDAKCPSMANLTDESYLDSSMRTTDAWDNAFRLRCKDHEVHAMSAGPDEMFGTSDDVY